MHPHVYKYRKIHETCVFEGNAIAFSGRETKNDPTLDPRFKLRDFDPIAMSRVNLLKKDFSLKNFWISPKIMLQIRPYLNYEIRILLKKKIRITDLIVNPKPKFPKKLIKI